MSQKTHGGKRPGAGRPSTTTAKTPLGVSVAPEDRATLSTYPNRNRAVSLLASGLRLGKGNVGELTSDEAGLLWQALSGTYLDALTIRHLADEVAALADEFPNHAPALAQKMRAWGDWELMHVALVYGGPQRPAAQGEQDGPEPG